MSGWIKLHRDFTKFEWYQDANTMRVFLHLLISANHKDAKWQGNTINRGQLITSHGNLANDLGLSIQNVRTSLSKLKSTENLTVKSTSKFTLISICNYDTYQSGDSTTNTPTNKPLTDDQQTTNKPLTTNKNVNKNNNEKNEKNKTESIHCVENLHVRLIKLLAPHALRTELNIKEGASFKKIKTPIREHDMELLEDFYRQDKSKTFNLTWKRRNDLVTILNNFEDQLDLAFEHRQQIIKSQPKISTPTEWS
jgi:hypothetical protein